MFSPIVSSTLQATAIAAASNVIAQLLEQRSKQVCFPCQCVIPKPND